MSKTQLKKELARLDHDQLAQLILDLYSARKEAKDYFEFFLDPDVTKLMEKYRAAIEKEMSRGKYGKITARMSKVRAAVKDFASYGVESESVVELMLYALGVGVVMSRTRFISTTFLNGMSRLANDILKYADKHCIFDATHRQLSNVLNGSVGSIRFVNYLRESLDWTLLSAR